MKTKALKDYSAQELDRMALDQSDVRPMSSAIRRKWEAAKQTGKRMHQQTLKGTGSGTLRPPNRGSFRFRSIRLLLSEADRYAKNRGR